AIPAVLATLAGFIPGRQVANPWGSNEILRAALAAIAVASCLSLALRRRHRRNEFGLLLLLAAAVPIGASAVSEQFYYTLGAGERLLAPSFILFSIAAAIELPNLVARIRSPGERQAVLAVASAVVLALAGSYVAGAVPLASRPPRVETMPHKQLADWLIARKFHYGVGDYWVGRTADALGGGAFLIASVLAQNGKLVRFEWESSKTEFDRGRPEFVVFMTPDVFNITLEAIRATYGPIASVEHVSDFTVAILPPR
ncbi:MAG: hypothetical protein ACREFC_03780, partial [Stellaceae bacterium]